MIRHRKIAAGAGEGVDAIVLVDDDTVARQEGLIGIRGVAPVGTEVRIGDEQRAAAVANVVVDRVD